MITNPQLAAALERARNRIFETGHENEWQQGQYVASALSMTYLLQELGLKTPLEFLWDAVNRLKQPEHYDLLNEKDREFMALMLQDMYEPLAVNRIIMIGITPEGKAFITQIIKSGDEGWSSDQLKEILIAIGDNENESTDLPL